MGDKRLWTWHPEEVADLGGPLASSVASSPTSPLLTASATCQMEGVQLSRSLPEYFQAISWIGTD
jgi:hypothetical protein